MNYHETRFYNKKSVPIYIGFNSFQNKNSLYIESACAPNWHDDIELLYCTEGEGEIISRGNLYHIKQNEFVIINSREIHQLLVPKKPIKYYYILIDYEYCLSNGIQLDFCIFESLINDTESIEKLNQVLLAYKNKDAENFNDTALCLAILTFLLHLAKHHLVNSNMYVVNNLDKSAHRMIEIVKYIQDNFTKKITIEDISKHFFISRSQLTRIFRKYTGGSITHYINHLRCNYAYQLLCSNQYSISKISEICGFSNTSYFIKVFKSFHQVLPSSVKTYFEKREVSLFADKSTKYFQESK